MQRAASRRGEGSADAARGDIIKAGTMRRGGSLFYGIFKSADVDARSGTCAFISNRPLFKYCVLLLAFTLARKQTTGRPHWIARVI